MCQNDGYNSDEENDIDLFSAKKSICHQPIDDIVVNLNGIFSSCFSEKDLKEDQDTKTD